jgi:hypothetical protein
VSRKVNEDTNFSTPLSPLPSSSFLQAFPQPLPHSSHPSSTGASSTISSHVEDILSPGDIVGEGLSLLGEALLIVPNKSPEQPHIADYEDPAREFEVVRKLGTGSYAVVYLVREVLSRSSSSEDDPICPGGLELDDATSMQPPTVYGREHAIKLLSKADLDEEELVAQLTEVRFRCLYSFLALRMLFFLCLSPKGDHPPVPS